MNNILFIFLAEYPREPFHSSWIFGPKVHQFEAHTTWGVWSQEYGKKKNNIFFFSPYMELTRVKKEEAVLLALNTRIQNLRDPHCKNWKISKTRVEDPIFEIFHFCKVAFQFWSEVFVGGCGFKYKDQIWKILFTSEYCVPMTNVWQKKNTQKV